MDPLSKTVPFYKNSALYVFIIYTYIIYTYGLIPTDIYRPLTYPYGLKTVPGILKSVFISPIGLYLLIFTIFYPSLTDLSQPGSKPYFNAAFISFFVGLGIYLIHVGITRLLIKADNIDVAEEFLPDKVDKTYSNLFKTQWSLILYLGPIYAFCVVFVANML